MKRSLLLLLVLTAILPALAETDRGPRVTLNYNRADLPSVVKQLGKRMGCNVYVGPEVAGQVTLSVKDTPAEGVLKLVLELQPKRFDYKLVGNTLVVASPERLGSIPADLLGPRR